MFIFFICNFNYLFAYVPLLFSVQITSIDRSLFSDLNVEAVVPLYWLLQNFNIPKSVDKHVFKTFWMNSYYKTVQGLQAGRYS